VTDTAARLSPKMREALSLLRLGTLGFVHSGSDVYGDPSETWVGFRTAKALQRRGLARIDWTDCQPGEDYPELVLTDAGKAVSL
jgi:hypothetical protein